MSCSFFKLGAVKAANILQDCPAGTYSVIYYFSENQDMTSKQFR